MFFGPIPLAADDMQCTTNANPLHLCAIMLPFLAKYDRDDLCSEIVHRRALPSKDKFSVFASIANIDAVRFQWIEPTVRRRIVFSGTDDGSPGGEPRRGDLEVSLG